MNPELYIAFAGAVALLMLLPETVSPPHSMFAGIGLALARRG